MPQMMSLAEARARTFRDKGGNRRTPFLDSTAATPQRPLAFLMEYEPGYVTHPHLHLADQWQVVVGGDGLLGRRAVAPWTIHYTRACTPYGPVVGGAQEGIAFFVLFPCYQPGAQYLPGARAILDSMPDRRPWQISRRVAIPALTKGETARCAPVPEVEDANGMFASALVLAPHAQAMSPDASGGSGQYVLAVQGSLLDGGVEHPAPALVWIDPAERSVPLQAGAAGLEAIVLNFAGKGQDVPTASVHSRILARWQCAGCGFTYDERDGLPARGIAAETRWETLTGDWTCPGCGTGRTGFRKI